MADGNSKERRAELERQWTAIIEQAREHPGGIKDYCLRNGVSDKAYYVWFGKLRPQHPEWKRLPRSTKPRRRQKKSKSIFVPVNLQSTEHTFQKTVDKVEPMQIVTPGGLLVRVPTISKEQLYEVLIMLKQC